MNEYDKQARAFLDATGVKFSAKFAYYGAYFDGDEEKRDVYYIVLERGDRSYGFTFGQSIQNSCPWIHNAAVKNPYRKYKGEIRKHDLSSHDRGAFVRNKHYRAPSAYDVLACLDPFCPDTFKEFCWMFGYNEDSRAAEKTFNACREQSSQLRALFNSEECEQLAEIA